MTILEPIPIQTLYLPLYYLHSVTPSRSQCIQGSMVLLLCSSLIMNVFSSFHCLSLFLSAPLELNDTYSEGNTDTVGQIVHYIMKNEGRRA